MANRKSAWGTHSMVFWRFYESQKQRMKKEYGEITDAARAQRSMLAIVRRKGIYEVRIARRRNVLYLEKIGVKKK
nr:hypothetical protein [uncultured Acetatifactor sp.]